MSDIFIFIDTEFTSFEKPELISLALVRNEHDFVYFEFEEFEKTLCSDFVHTTVLPLLGLKSEPKNLIISQIKEFLMQQSKKGQVYLVGDDSIDWELFLQLVQTKKEDLNIAGFLNLHQYLQYSAYQNSYKPRLAKEVLKNIPKIFEAYYQSWFLDNNKAQHHALFDAQANCRAFEQTLAYIERHKTL